MGELNIHACRLFQLLQYFTVQSRALLLAVICIGRYFIVISTAESFISKLLFGTAKAEQLRLFHS